MGATLTERVRPLATRIGQAVSIPKTVVALDAAHMMALCGEFRTVTSLLGACSVGGDFWGEYARGLLAAIEGRPFGCNVSVERAEGVFLELRTRYYQPYLDLIVSRHQGRRDQQSLCTKLDELFLARLEDRRWRIGLGFDGDGREPARWDLRRAAINACFEYR